MGICAWFNVQNVHVLALQSLWPTCVLRQVKFSRMSFTIHPSAVIVHSAWGYSHKVMSVNTPEFTDKRVCVKLQMCVHKSSGVCKSHTSGFQRIRFFISSTLLCVTPKQRPCRDTEMLNYSSSHSIKHEYPQRVPTAIIHASSRKQVLLFFPPRMPWGNAKGLSDLTSVSTAFFDPLPWLY